MLTGNAIIFLIWLSVVKAEIVQVLDGELPDWYSGSLRYSNYKYVAELSEISFGGYFVPGENGEISFSFSFNDYGNVNKTGNRGFVDIEFVDMREMARFSFVLVGSEIILSFRKLFYLLFSIIFLILDKDDFPINFLTFPLSTLRQEISIAANGSLDGLAAFSTSIKRVDFKPLKPTEISGKKVIRFNIRTVEARSIHPSIEFVSIFLV